jgi:hypothetical protein
MDGKMVINLEWQGVSRISPEDLKITKISVRIIGNQPEIGTMYPPGRSLERYRCANLLDNGTSVIKPCEVQTAYQNVLSGR